MVKLHRLQQISVRIFGMTARTHDAFAFASLLTAAVAFPPASLNIPTLFASLVGNIVGALIPDMDQASNRLWDLVPAGNYVGRIFRNLFLSHRTLSHSLLGFYLIGRLLDWGLPKFVNSVVIDVHILYISIMIGYGSHLLADALTKDGLPLFFPFKIKIGFPPMSFLRVTTGSWVENLVVMPMVLFYLIWFINTYQTTLLGIFASIS